MLYCPSVKGPVQWAYVRLDSCPAVWTTLGLSRRAIRIAGARFRIVQQSVRPSQLRRVQFVLCESRARCRSLSFSQGWAIPVLLRAARKTHSRSCSVVPCKPIFVACLRLCVCSEHGTFHARFNHADRRTRVRRDPRQQHRFVRPRHSPSGSYPPLYGLVSPRRSGNAITTFP